MKYILLILLSLTITTLNLETEPLSGQAKLDSLLSELPKAKGDTNEVNLLGDISFWYNSSNPDKGIEYGQKGLALAQKINWKKGEANCYNTLGVNFNSQSNYLKALDFYKRALKINEEIKYKRGISTNIGNMGIIYKNQSNYPKALEYYQKALKINQELNDKKGISLNLVNIGNIYSFQSNYPKALEYYQMALKINEDSGNKLGVALNLANIGSFYNSQLNFTKAFEYFQKALNIYSELSDKKGVAICLVDIGNTYLNRSNYPKALKYYIKALKINKELNDKSGIAISYINIGNLYVSNGELDKSLDYLKRGLQLSLEIGNNRLVTGALKYITNYYLSRTDQIKELKDNGKVASLTAKLKKENLYKEALQFGLRAEKIADSSGIRELQYWIFLNLSEIYENLNQPWKALEYHKKYTLSKDSIFNQKNADKISALEKSREDDLKQKEIEKQKAINAEQRKREQLIIYFSIGFFIVMSIVMFVIYRLLKRSDKLLYNVLPVSIAKRLKKKEHPISDNFTQASIIFIDIVNFTVLSRDADPQRIVLELNKIFTHYDTIADKYGLEKIKTIGDSYMAAAGIPEIQEDNTHRAAQMALEVKELMEDYHTSDGTKIEVRIGLDCGPVVAGVIGEKKFIYDMWSDAVNTASRMESSSIAGEIQVSERFKTAVTKYQDFDYTERGEIEIKGKGKMKTYFMGSQKVEA